MAEYLTTATEIQGAKNFSSVEANVINKHLPSAKQDVIGVIGSEKYSLLKEAEDVLPGDETEDNPYNSEDFTKAQLAETYMAIPYVISAINDVTTGDGVTKVTGFQDSRKENLSESDIEDIEDRYKKWAYNLLKVYVADYDPDEDDDNDRFVTNDIMGFEI